MMTVLNILVYYVEKQVIHMYMFVRKIFEIVYVSLLQEYAIVHIQDKKKCLKSPTCLLNWNKS